MYLEGVTTDYNGSWMASNFPKSLKAIEITNY